MILMIVKKVRNQCNIVSNIKEKMNPFSLRMIRSKRRMIPMIQLLSNMLSSSEKS